MKKFFAGLLVWVSLTGNAFALLPLIPLGFNIALVGTAAAGLALPLVGAAVVVGAIVGLVTLNSSSPSDPSLGPIKVQINPSEPLPTPTGWTPAVAPSVNPSPPASGGSPAGLTGVIATSNANAVSLCLSSASGTPIQLSGIQYEVGILPYAIPSGFVFNQACGASTYPGRVGQQANLYIRTNNCPSGYTQSGSNCNLTSPSLVVKPSDGQCQIIRVGNTFSNDPQDPDCAAGNVPTTVSVTGTQITARPSATQTDSVKINGDGSTTITTSVINSGNNTTTTTTINISAGTGIGTTKITGIGTTTVNGTGDQAGVGTAPAAAFPTDYNRESTQTAIKATLDAIKAGQCGAAGQPKCAIDETGTPTAETLAPGKAEVSSSMDARKSQIEQSGDKTSWPSPFAITFPVSASCTDLSFAIPHTGKTLDLPICSKFAPVRTVIEWMLGIFCAWSIYGIATSAVKGS